MTGTARTIKAIKGGGFLTEDLAPDEIFTPEDITDEQHMFARTAEEFLRKEVLPREDAIYAKDYSVSRDPMLSKPSSPALSISSRETL